MNSSISFTALSWRLLNVSVDEPEELDIESVLENCYTALITADILNRMPIIPSQTDKLELHVYIDVSNTSFTFPLSVNKALKIADDFVFSDAITVLTIQEPDSIPDPPSLPPTPTAPHKFGRQIIVSSNIVAHQLYASSKGPLLRRFLKKNTKDLVHLTFPVVYYYSLKYTELKHISVAITDEDLHLIPVSDTPTVLNIYFRKKR